MNRILRTILTALATPDDQGDDWYAWATNQCGHFTVGVILAGAVWFAVHDPLLAGVASISTALLKELSDYRRSPRRWADVRDSIRDVGFWTTGALTAIALSEADGALFAITLAAAPVALASGVVSRVRRQWGSA